VITQDDCQRCGACCTNPPENRAEGYSAYVEIAPSDAILKRRDLVKKLVVLDENETPHLRMSADGRCLALAGALMKSVKCTIYHHRPSPCRRVEAGSALCLKYREGLGA
jgi:Fe-S-cluster containining protein